MNLKPIAAGWAVGLLCGLLLYTLLELPAPGARSEVDPREIGLSWAWLAFGFGAQALFMSRMLIQWIATERARASVVPVSFWVISLLGGLSLLAYFIRRGDPVGMVGQATGVLIYVRNLVFIRRNRIACTAANGVGNPGAGSPAMCAAGNRAECALGSEATQEPEAGQPRLEAPGVEESTTPHPSVRET